MPTISIEADYLGQTWFNGTSYGKDDLNGSVGYNIFKSEYYKLRVYIRFSLATLPSGALVTQARRRYYCGPAGGSAHLTDEHAYGTNGQEDPEPDTAEVCYGRCVTGNLYTDDSPELRSTGFKWRTLGGTICQDIMNAKTAVNRFSLGVHEEGDDDAFAGIYNVTECPRPVLEITYISYVGAGTAAASSGGSTGSVTPTLPSGLEVNDLMLIFASGRGNHVFSVSGWTQKWQLAHASSGINKIALFYKFYQVGDGNPTVSWTGGGTNQSVIAQVCAFRGVDLITPFDVQGSTSSNASQQNIGAVAGITTGAYGRVIIVFGHKADDWTSVATLSGDGLTWNEIGEPDTTLGNDAGEVWDYAFALSGSVTVTDKNFVVTNGGAQTGMGVMQSLNAPIPPPAVGYSYSDGLVTVRVAG